VFVQLQNNVMTAHYRQFHHFIVAIQTQELKLSM